MRAHPILFFGGAIGYLLLAAAFIFDRNKNKTPGRGKKMNREWVPQFGPGGI